MSATDPRDPDREPSDGSGHGADDIDAEFARLMEGISLDEAPLTVEDVLTDAAEEEQIPSIAVLATSVASATALAGVIRLGREARTDGLDIPVGTRTLDSGTGAIAVGPLEETAAHDLAAISSTALQRTGLVLFWRRGDRMTDDVVEELLLGATDLAELGEGLDPSALSRAEALEWIAKGKKRK